MGDDQADRPAAGEHVVTIPARAVESRRRWRRVGAAVGLVVVTGLLAAWLARERIAGGLIAGELDALGLPATYRIVSIGPARQVLADVVIGDPQRPDLTIERLETTLAPRFGLPAIRRVVLVQPKLRGSWRGGKVSFGSLDAVLFGGGTGQPFRLPDLDLGIVAGRAMLRTDHGPVGLAIAGSGHLRGGFAGRLAIASPLLAAGGCEARRPVLSGSLGVRAERPRFVGPLRLDALDCPDLDLRLGAATARLDIAFDRALNGAEGTVDARGGPFAAAQRRAATLLASARLAWRDGAVTARYRIAAEDIAAPELAARSLALEGALRAGAGLARVEAEGRISGRGLVPGRAVDAALASAARGTSGTFAAPLLAQVRAALAREGTASTLAGDYLARRSGEALTLIVPSAAWRAESGAPLLSLSRFELVGGGGRPAGISANLASGGPGMPRITGRIGRGAAEDGGGRGFTARLAMAEYRADDARLAVPQLSLVGLAGGTIGFAGEARISGPLPGGGARGLVLPLEGTWSHGELALWRDCATVRFDRLRYADLTLDARGLQLCPPRGGAIVRSGARGTRIAAGASALAVSGSLGATPIRIATGPIGFAVPGTLVARDVAVALGSPDRASRLRIDRLEARIGSEIAGRFEGSQVGLAAVPLDLDETAGQWRYADGRLTIAGGSFRLLDRAADRRFEPLVARGAMLALVGNRITAHAVLRAPASDREVVRADIVHDPAAGAGSAELAVAGITFDKALQPATLTPLALGVIANARGTLRGAGRIDWNPRQVTSSGRLTTDALDFAAALGPVTGLSGTIAFTDLLGLVTAPGQQLRIAAINPGIEVDDGTLTYALKPGHVLAIEGGTWPFLGGTLSLEPAAMTIGGAETRRFTLDIAGLDAARLVERMDLSNLSASGTFDGRLPLVFDESGGRIEGGTLRSRPPGGNISYVGELSYKDLSAMANFAFDALKSLDYREMSVAMDGAIAGEIVTRLRFIGVRQGEGARQNFITRRISRAPLQFNVNLRAPFFQLVSSFKSLYDPHYIRDPRDLGLLHPDGSRQQPPVQPPASGEVP